MRAPFPDFFVPGAPRCGTTALSSWLSEHPLICFSKPKETFYFSTPTWRPGDETRWRQEYPRFFQHWKPEHQKVGEGTVSYLYDGEAQRRILKIQPDARFIVMVRNPLEMVPSLHQRMLFLLEEDEPDFARAWRLQERRSAGEQLPPLSTDPRLLLYAEAGCLGAQLEALLARVPREHCHVIVFDDFRRDPASAYRGVLHFLGLPDDGRKDFRPHQAGQHYRYRWLQRLMIRPPGITRTLRQERLQNADRKASRRRNRQRPKPWSKRMYRRVRDWNRIAVPAAPLPTELREELCTRFSPDVALLGELLGRNLSHWCAPPEGVE